MHATAEFEGTRPDGWDPSCACYSVVISPADDGAFSPDPDELACAAHGQGHVQYVRALADGALSRVL